MGKPSLSHFIPLVSRRSGIYCFHLAFSLSERGKDKARLLSGSSQFIAADTRFKSMCPTTDLIPRPAFLRKKKIHLNYYRALGVELDPPFSGHASPAGHCQIQDFSRTN